MRTDVEKSLRSRDPRIVKVKSVGPNEKCLCGSGKKFKKCCMFRGIEQALDRFAEAGRKAWADVPDAAEWVRKLRGGV